ncbi:MAG: hypothetical protein U0Y08_11565 [Bacteroidia bacterium]
MKKQRLLHLMAGTVVAANCLLSTDLHAQNTFPANGSVGIGTTTTNTTSILELNSVNKVISCATDDQNTTRCNCESCGWI